MAISLRPATLSRPLASLTLVWLLSLAACANEPSFGAQHQELRVCADGPTVDGIDVSKWQGVIDWDAVAGDGVRFAFIRVSHGVGIYDEQYTRNWAEARRVGILRGTYQYFQPDEDPIAQADLLLENMGTLMADDLPPVIDVEATGGLGAAAIAASVQAWLDHVEAATGRTPIIYSGYYFWRDNVGDPPGFTRYPLWIPQYGPVCPLIPDSWPRWDFFQTSASGRFAGIVGDVDTDLWNGTLDTLLAFANPTPATPVCGDGRCTGTETNALCPMDCMICEPVPPLGRVVEETELCFDAGGPSAGWRSVDGAGSGGHVLWTYAVATATENPGTWNLEMAEAGSYRVEAYTPAPYASSVQAPYTVRHAGTEDAVLLDQSAVDGWQSLGDFDFAAGGDQWVRLVDSTGEPYADRIVLGFDALRLTRLDAPQPDGGVAPIDAGRPIDVDARIVARDGGAPPPSPTDDSGCGCRVAPRAPGAPGPLALFATMFACVLVVARRRLSGRW